ncbi:MAG: hypothetical protein AB7F79_10980 [Steroidobacteraceae bacterium]
MPVGFMAQVSGGQLRLVFCNAGYAQNLVIDDVAGDAGHHGDNGQADFSCPFAHAAAALLLDISGSDAITLFHSAELLPPVESPYYAVGPPRFIATRGPPVLA